MGKKATKALITLSISNEIGTLQAAQRSVRLFDALGKDLGSFKEVLKIVVGGLMLKEQFMGKPGQTIAYTLIADGLTRMFLAPMEEMKQIYTDILKSWFLLDR